MLCKESVNKGLLSLRYLKLRAAMEETAENFSVAVGDVNVALDFKAHHTLHLRQKALPTGGGGVKLIHIKLFYVTLYPFQWCHVTFSSIFKNFGP